MEPFYLLPEKQIPCCRRTEKIVQYIEAHLHETVRIKTISERFGISVSTVRNYFSVCYHTPFHLFVEKLRMEKAYQLISEEGMLVKQAMLLTGYRNRATFRRAFQRHFNKLPSAFIHNW